MTVFHASRIDRIALRAYRLGRVREQLRQRDLMGVLLYDPLNIRYATDTSNMQVWTLHNKVRYAFVATEGPVILFDYGRCRHLSTDIEVVDEMRPAISYSYFATGSRSEEMAGLWAAEIADLVRHYGGGDRRLAVDKLDPLGSAALAWQGVQLADGDALMEHARAIKNDLEIAAMQEAIDACEAGMQRMHTALRPGIIENALWSILHQTNIELGGEWIETRLLSSGERTFPWFRECSNRVIQAGDLVSFDTDLIGPNGYCADISRSWLCGEVNPSSVQRDLYRIAMEQIEHNTDLLQPGMMFREYAERAYRLPAACQPYRYGSLAHGVGLCDEYPVIRYAEDFERIGYDGVIAPGMVLCVESLVGTPAAGEAVKLEEQVLITERGPKTLSRYPFESVLLD